MNDNQGADAGINDCPAWCTREHLASNHVEDQVHRGAAISVPATRRRALLPEFEPEATDYVVLPAALDGEHEQWIVIAEAEGVRKVAFDRSTASRMVDALQRVLAELDQTALPAR